MSAFYPVRLLCLTAFLALSGLPAVQAAPEVVHLRAEYHINPVGIDVLQPRLSWQMQPGAARGVTQTAYQIQVAAHEGFAGEALLWDTGRVASDQSTQVVYGGPAPESGQRYHWRVRVWDAAGTASAWSAPAFWEMGLLTPDRWQAHWITGDWTEDPAASQPVALFRKAFAVDGQIAQARVYATSRGLYSLALNGRPVGEDLFTPGWTSYNKRLQYQTYDVTAHLQQDENVIGAQLADGWYRGYLGWSDQRNNYGERTALLVQLEITYTDGRKLVVATDDTWRAGTGPILMSDLYMGETYDARLEKPGWDAPGYAATGWQGVRVADHPKTNLIAQAGPPVRQIEEVRPVALFQTPEGDTVFDMGQNMVGWVRLRVEGPAGTTVTLRHAEVLDKHGNFYTENLRAAQQTVRYTLNGKGVEVYAPRYSFQGFRYVAVDGYPGTPTLESMTGIVVHSAMAPTGTFTCSDALLNRLQENIRWGQKGNFLDVPTDCPQRDERMGWTGDAQVFARTAGFNMDVAAFFTKWLADLAADQFDDGRIPFVVPDVLGGGGATGWADAGVIIPWTMYQVYGDVRILDTQYASMKAWVAYMAREAGPDYLWTGGRHFGDWLAFAPARPDYPGATTSKDLLATAFFAHSSDLLSRIATVLGKAEEAAAYATLYEHIKTAFQQEYITATGRVGEDTQTAYALALRFGLVPEALRPRAAERLVENIRGHGTHLSTGFLGTPHLTHALSENGYTDVAFALLHQTSYPSWLYPVTQGATTIWERWDGQKTDSTFQTPEMNSFNHYAYGAIGDWMYRVVAGLDTDPARPGYKHLLVHPHPGGKLTQANAQLETMYGTARAGWALEGDQFKVFVQVAPNTTASVHLPGAVMEEVQEVGGPDAAALAVAEGVTAFHQKGEDVLLELASGTYTFVYPAGRLMDRFTPPETPDQP